METAVSALACQAFAMDDNSDTEDKEGTGKDTLLVNAHAFH
jgi:hypothetical protein